jgi:fructose-1,6-bisphosphatase/sedoheptulose 1,7-bisphosphatase-like protein
VAQALAILRSARTGSTISCSDVLLEQLVVRRVVEVDIEIVREEKLSTSPLCY